MSKAETKYYTLPLKKALNMMTDAERGVRMFASSLKTLTEKYDIEGWSSSPIPDYMEAYLSAKLIMDYLKKRIEEPDEAVVAYLKQNNLEGLLFTREELVMLHTIVSNFDNTKEYLSKTYGYSTMLN